MFSHCYLTIFIDTKESIESSSSGDLVIKDAVQGLIF